MQTFEATRPTVGAQAIGVARAAYEYSLDYAKEREAFGRKIIMNQSIAFMLADMATEIEATRLLIWRAAWLGKTEGVRNAEGSMAKLKAGRVATHVTERAIQILGGYGYTREYPVERWHRDAKIHDIFEGTEQIQQLVISRAISGLASSKSGMACDGTDGGPHGDSQGEAPVARLSTKLVEVRLGVVPGAASLDLQLEVLVEGEHAV